jgi:thiopurine S-methyltransferase
MIDNERWHTAWQEGRTRFNQAEYNPSLVKLFDKFKLKPESRVFVPLCGKTIDMLFFSEKNHHVTGVDVVTRPIKEFFIENDIGYSIEGNGLFKGVNYDLYARDFFEMSFENIKPFDLIYDRASMVALPEDVRKLYVTKLKPMIDAGAKLFLITLERENEADGPPFCITDKEVRDHYKGYKIDLIEEESKEIELSAGMTSLTFRRYNISN